MRRALILVLTVLAGCGGSEPAPAPPETASSSLERDLDSASEWISEALESSGYTADYSVASTTELDRFFTEQMRRPGVAKPGGLLSDDLGQRLWAIGAYVGTVLEREYGAEWRLEGVASDEEVAMELPDGSTVWPVQRVIKRYENGIEDSLAIYVLALRKRG
jgi:hypothetical protein